MKLAKMLTGGMIVVVRNYSQACMAEDVGARAVIPMDPTAGEQPSGGGSIMDLHTIKNIMDRVLIPVIARVRIGHEMDAQLMEAAHVDYIDECTLLHQTGLDHVSKHMYHAPFIGEASNLSEALIRIGEGSSLIRTKIEGGNENATNIATTINTVKTIIAEIKGLTERTQVQLSQYTNEGKVSIDLVRMVARDGRLPVPFFAGGGVIMPIDVALLMRLGCDGVIVSTNVFGVMAPESRLKAILRAIDEHKSPDKMTDLIELTGGYGK
ncbi:Pyridoxal 5'-phosphate synthase subunit snz1 [Coemansia nantahalensis]|uniref:Pyridoxal 5'-phosphate synthase subunit snz1 n=1 Tax=Coemansia nantahalensis TaxID=2789366 RepID=A0ACC1K3Z9_9FUNG|nr:Pyridoxal 5'-phosphate synthase subunit snz1 [Coemansia nantahalensis]KAJ2772818.1 Pyridoxal 5'-phosphate synthase subunit snz1 [Coemansia nantahalensis]